APTAPKMAPLPNDWVADAHRQAPDRPPVTMRASKGARAVRLGTLGNLSAINSPIASTERITRTGFDSMNPRDVPSKCNQPRRAAKATAAGAVNERKPATTPTPPARAKTKFALIGASASLQVVVEPRGGPVEPVDLV